MGEIDAVSAWLAAARWLTSVASILLVGHIGARIVCARAFGVDVSAPLATDVERRLTRSFAFAAILLVVSVALLLLTQSYSWFGTADMFKRDKVAAMITNTRWGQGWTTAAVMAGATLLGSLTFLRWRAARLVRTTALALGVALAIPLAGHGGGHGNVVWLIHAGHLFGAGLWIGTLVVLLMATWPLWIGGGPVLPTLLRRFSPIALVGAGLMVSTGLVLTWEYVRPLEMLWESEYGRTLIAKVSVVVSTAALGFLNWRRFGPRAADDGGRRTLRRITVAEACLALVAILGLTAWLSGLPLPMTFED